MSNLVCITTKFYDKSGRYVINLEVQSRYKNSSKTNKQKTNDQGVFVFQASPNRTIEILARPPKQKDFTVFKTINSSTFSSLTHPVRVQLPKTIDEYRQVSQSMPAKGIVSTVFKITDSNGKVMKNFPIQSRPKGKGNSPDKYTSENGIVEVLSSPNRDIEVVVLTSNDEFQLKFSDNSGNGTEQPITIKLDESYEKFKSITTIKILDRDGSDYVIEKTNVEVLNLNTKEKNIHSTSDGKIRMTSMVGESYQLTVYKPDGKPLKSQSYMATRIKNKPVELYLDVDITKGNTAVDEPIINKRIENSLCTCNRDITDEEFQLVIKSKTALGFLKDLNEQFKKLGMNTCMEKAHFIAHTLHETGGYSLLEEGLKKGVKEKDVYDGYKGRGLMQITYKKNYEAYGQAVNENFTDENKYRVANERNHAVGSAVWYWYHSKAGNLSIFALKNDLISTTSLINGGYNGFDDRLQYYKKTISAFNIKKCSNLEKNIINRLDDYTSFEESYIYRNKSGESFGWGLWNDPLGKKEGKTKNIEEAKKGYQRFLELSKNIDFPFGYTINKKQEKVSRKRYGYSADRAKEFAKNRVEKL
ncbi:pyocin R, lytic enzyme [Acinetobacter guerrae]|uniref:Pyocin R, lytic enzyme n=1 Tax=Acinetobacter guerrae TaxID=1843371 RepID=A0A3A8EFT7_9GAMM|nr:glycoside hydrolase family 19 protein [Acinetobacter guerrae]RKG32958.1 pyocin R, lytic enzyme [Acinetobacter guerrae]